MPCVSMLASACMTAGQSVGVEAVQRLLEPSPCLHGRPAPAFQYMCFTQRDPGLMHRDPLCPAPHAGSRLMSHHKKCTDLMESDLTAPTIRDRAELDRPFETCYLLPATVRRIQGSMCVSQDRQGKLRVHWPHAFTIRVTICCNARKYIDNAERPTHLDCRKAMHLNGRACWLTAKQAKHKNRANHSPQMKGLGSSPAYGAPRPA